MATGKRKFHSADFKAKVALEAVKGVATVNEIAQRYSLHPGMVQRWKRDFLENASSVFETKRGPKPAEHASEDALYGEIGRLKMELDWLKKSRGYKHGYQIELG